MDFFEHLHKYMTSNPKLKELFGNRVYPQNMPQNPLYPSVVYCPINARYDKNLLCESGFTRQIVQFNIYDESFGKTRKASRMISEVFKNFCGDMAGKRIEAVHSIADITAKSNTAENFNTEEYCTILEFEFQFNA